MASITTRRRKDGSIAYTAQIRIRRNGKLVHQEAQTFDRQRHAKEWMQRRELELRAPGGLEEAKQPEYTVGGIIQRYLNDLDALQELGLDIGSATLVDLNSGPISSMLSALSSATRCLKSNGTVSYAIKRLCKILILLGLMVNGHFDHDRCYTPTGDALKFTSNTARSKRQDDVSAKRSASKNRPYQVRFAAPLLVAGR